MAQPGWLVGLTALAALASVVWVVYSMMPQDTEIPTTSPEYAAYLQLCGDTRCY